MNKLSPQDRSVLIRLASTLPVGSPDRKAILSGLSQNSRKASGNFNIPDKHIFDNAEVSDNARVYDRAMVYDDAKVSDNAKVFGDAEVFERGQVSGDAQVSKYAYVFGDAQVFGKARIGGAGVGRPRPVLGELSAEAKAARAPLPPEELVEAQHDRVHRDPGRARAARTVRNSRRETT